MSKLFAIKLPDDATLLGMTVLQEFADDDMLHRTMSSWTCAIDCSDGFDYENKKLINFVDNDWVTVEPEPLEDISI